MKMHLLNRLALGFAAALLLLGLNAYVAHDSVRNLIESEHWVEHTDQVLREIETDVSLAKDVETGTRGYVITSNQSFLQPYLEAQKQVEGKLEPLLTLTRDNPSQQKRVVELNTLIDRKLQISRHQIDLVNNHRHVEAVASVSSGVGKIAMDAVQAKADEMSAEENRLLKLRLSSSNAAKMRATATTWVAMLFSLLLLSLVYSQLARAKLQSVALGGALHDLERLEAMRDSLNAMLVHDLRTPLTTMLGPLEMLQGEQFGHLEETQREIVGMSLLSSRRLLGLVNELLDISKMEAGEMKVRHESLRPQVVINEAISHIALAQFDGSAKIDAEVPDNLPLLQADQELLTRVLINLLGNAVKFTPAGGKITLGARQCTPLDVLPARLQPSANGKSEPQFSAPAVLFCVSDSGEGIPATDLDRIFDKFGQVEGRQSGRKMSTGLGLTFCKLAVEAHGGLIWVESEVGRGSTFYFTVPLRTAQSDEETNKNAAATAVA